MTLLTKRSVWIKIVEKLFLPKTHPTLAGRFTLVTGEQATSGVQVNLQLEKREGCNLSLLVEMRNATGKDEK